MHTSLQPLGECHCWCTFVTSLFNFLNYFVWLRITDEGSIPEMRIHEIRFKMLYMYTTWSLFIFQPLHSLGECHCWWTRESLRAHVAKFYGRLQLIRSVSRASTFSVLKFIDIVIFGVYLTFPLVSVCFGFFLISLFNLFIYFVWPRITDDGSVLEMRIWSILLSLFSYCKSQAFTPIPCEFFAKYMPKAHFSFKQGGGGSTLIYLKFVLSLCNQISTSTFDLRLTLLVPPQSENASYAPVSGEMSAPVGEKLLS